MAVRRQMVKARDLLKSRDTRNFALAYPLRRRKTAWRHSSSSGDSNTRSVPVNPFWASK